MLPALTRGQKILAAVAIVIIALYVTGVATQGGSGGTPDPSQHRLVKLLGGWFGGADQVTPEELTSPCLAGDRMSVKDGCVLTVAPSGKDLREVRLRPEQGVRLQARAAHDDTVLEEDLAAGDDVKVAVDGDGVEITLTCRECVIVVGG